MFEDEFAQILQDYTDAVADKKRINGLLHDVFPRQPMQVNLLGIAYDLDIATELQSTAAITNAFAFRFVKRMIDDYGVSRVNADWAVAAWCVCYGQRTLHKHCDIKLPKQGQPAITPSQNASTGRQYGDLFQYTQIPGGWGVTGFAGADKRTLIFQNRHNGQPVKSILYRAFAGCEVEQIVLTEGIEVIEGGAFAGCSKLKQAIFPATFKRIGDNVFEGCTSLCAAALPPSLERIGSFAFAGSGIKNPVLPQSLYFLGDGAFSGCKRIEKFDFPNGLDVVAPKLFDGCAALRRVTLPAALNRIGERAFAGCSQLIQLSVPDTVTFIGEDAFSSTGKDFTLLCGRGTVTEEYARKHGIKYQIDFY